MPAWDEAEIDSWQTLTTAAEHAGRAYRAFSFSYLARGCSDASWTLQTSLMRATTGVETPAAVLRIESSVLRMFREGADLWEGTHFPPNDDLFDWWGVLQHHGAPTRLLDWTASMYVAAYFAAASDWDKDGAIWVFKPHVVAEWGMAERERLIAEKVFPLEAWPKYTHVEDELMLSPAAPHILIPSSVNRYWSQRMVAQQGNFTAGINVLTDHQAAIASAFESLASNAPLFDCGRLIVKKEAKPTIIRQLMAMNVHAAALFPTIDGFGQSLALRARLESLERR